MADAEEGIVPEGAVSASLIKGTMDAEEGVVLDTGAAAPEEATEPPPSTPPAPQALSLDDVVDDFSLQAQGVRFRAARGKDLRVYERPTGQLVLEEAAVTDDGDAADKEGGGVLVKTVPDKSYAFGFLRASYSLMATFVAGFLFILGIDILLFLFIDLTTKLGVTSSASGPEPVHFILVLLSIPLFVYSLAMAMTLMGRFVVDTFYGHPFLQSFGMGVATTDWIAFVLYIGIPIVTFIVTLFAKLDNWWEISLMSWFSSILLFWCLFSACVFGLELWVFYQLIDETNERDSLQDDVSLRGVVNFWVHKVGDGIYKTMHSRLAGKRSRQRKMGTANTHEHRVMDHVEQVLDNEQAKDTCRDWISLSNKKWNPCFEQNPEAVQLHTLDDVLGNTTYVTRYSWSLEKLFCRRGGIESAIPITRGESSITKAQIDSTIACSLLGNIIIVLLFISFLVWFGLPASVLAVVCVLFALYFIWIGYSIYRLFLLRRDIVNDESTAVYRFWEVYQHSKPKKGYVWAWVTLQIVFLYLLPLIYLCIENPNLAGLFACIGLCSGLRHYMNPRVLLLEEGKEDFFRDTFEVKSRDDRKKWRKRSLLYHLVAVGGDRARRFWTWTFIMLVVFFALIAAWAGIDYSSHDEDAAAPPKEPVALVEGYAYPPQPHLPYPTCEIKRGFDGDRIELQDFAFLAKLAYASGENRTTELLDLWFGEGVASNEPEVVEEFKASSYYEDLGFTDTSVSYKLISIASTGGAVVTIRGTQTVWDIIADAQLWMSALLFQLHRFVLPLSELFTPILHHMVYMVSQLESAALLDVSYYRETTAFVRYLKEVKGLKVAVTGHSLGGGLAIITGAQSNTSAVAISGVNAKLSRGTFVPPITVDELDRLTFNVVPNNDPVAMVDDKALLFQQINCTAATNNMIGCHDSSRSICELQYTCGSVDRPVLCECVLEYRYPVPLPTTNQTAESDFVQTCVDICKSSGGSSEKCAKWKEEYDSSQSR